MIALGIEGHVAVATNMLALIFMSVGGSLPFIGNGVLSRGRLRLAIVLTIIGSGLGAFLLLSIPLMAVQITIAVAMIGVDCRICAAFRHCFSASGDHDKGHQRVFFNGS
jgi:hypothetical protein